MIILVLASLDQSRTSLGPVAIETSCNQSFAVFSPVASKIWQKTGLNWTFKHYTELRETK